MKDSRVSEKDNDSFLDLLEDYFAQDEAALTADTRPQYHYQVGATLENTEKVSAKGLSLGCLSGAKNRRSRLTLSSPNSRDVILPTRARPQSPLWHLKNDHSTSKEAKLIPSAGERRPSLSAETVADLSALCSFFHRMGMTPPTTDFPSLSMENVTPAAFGERWEKECANWGDQIKRAVEGVSEALAVGLGLSKNTFTEAGTYGSHLLAPTATDLKKYGQVGESEARSSTGESIRN